MVRIYYTIFESISHEGEMGDEFNGFKRFNRFTGLAPGAYRPLIACERGGAGSVGSTGSKRLVRRSTRPHVYYSCTNDGLPSYSVRPRF